MRAHLDLARLKPIMALLLMTAAVSNAVAWHGGLDRLPWNVSLILIGLASVLWAIGYGFRVRSAPLGIVRWALILLPAYALFQSVPLPGRLVQWLSPTRAAMSRHALLIPLSIDPAVTWEHALRFMGYAFMFLLARGAVVRIRASLWVAVMPLLLVAAVEAVFGLAQQASSIRPQPVHGSYAITNHMAGLLEMVLPFAVMYAAYNLYSAASKGFSVVRAFQFCTGVSLSLLLLTTLLQTGSRMGLISTLAAGLTIAVLLKPAGFIEHRRARAIVAGLALLSAIAFVILMPTVLIERLSSLMSRSHIDFSMGERVRLWRESLPLLRDYPVFGCGLGTFAVAFAPYKDSSLSYAEYAHNDYLQFLIELGPLAWGLALCCMALILIRLYRWVSQVRSREQRFLGIATASSLTALLVHSLADFNLYIPANALVFSWVCGLAAGLTTLPSSVRAGVANATFV